jgi:hypothetical protein
MTAKAVKSRRKTGKGKLVLPILLLLCNAAKISSAKRLCNKTGRVYLLKNILQCTKLFAHKATKAYDGHRHQAPGVTA